MGNKFEVNTIYICINNIKINYNKTYVKHMVKIKALLHYLIVYLIYNTQKYVWYIHHQSKEQGD